MTPLDDETIASVVERTEGWGTGLRLATLALNSGVEAPGPITGDRYTSDYLIAEVLSHVPAVTQDFLLKTSILDRLCGSLCDTVAAPTDPAWDGRAYLEWLAAENIFTFSLDSQANWYRYHHLFQRLLRAQLERQRRKDEIASLHREPAPGSRSTAISKRPFSTRCRPATNPWPFGSWNHTAMRQ